MRRLIFGLLLSSSFFAKKNRINQNKKRKRKGKEWNGIERNGKESKGKQRKGKTFDHALGTGNKSGYTYTLTSSSSQVMGNCIPPLPLISRTKNGIKGLEKTKEKKTTPFFWTEEKRHKMRFAVFSPNMLQASMTVPRCRSLLLFTIGEEKQQPTRLQSNNAY